MKDENEKDDSEEGTGEGSGAEGAGEGSAAAGDTTPKPTELIGLTLKPDMNSVRLKQLVGSLLNNSAALEIFLAQLKNNRLDSGNLKSIFNLLIKEAAVKPIAKYVLARVVDASPLGLKKDLKATLGKDKDLANEVYNIPLQVSAKPSRIQNPFPKEPRPD